MKLIVIFGMKITNTTLNHGGWDGYWENVFHSSDVTPAVNEALLVLSSSLTRHAASLLNQDRLNACVLKPGSIKAVTSYFRRDHYQGNLFLFWKLLFILLIRLIYLIEKKKYQKNVKNYFFKINIKKKI